MTHPMPEISALLKRLRLHHINEYVAQRNREAIEKQLTYPEFLTLLLQDEIIARDNRQLAIRLKRSGLQANKTLENFNFSFNPKINRTQIIDLASGGFIYEKVPILIAGPTGTGKSHLAQALGHCIIRQGLEVIWVTQSRLLNELHKARVVGQYEKKLMALTRVPLLIIDDFGLQPMRSPQDEDFHRLIAERYERASTLVTSNLAWSEWGEAFPNQLLAAATLDRLRDQAYRIVLDGDSYRRSRDQTPNPNPNPKANRQS